MDSSPRKPSTHPLDAEHRGTLVAATALAAALAAVLALGGCTAFGSGEDAAVGDGELTESRLNRVANSASTGGVVNVRLVDGVAYVSGHVTTAIEENAVVRALRNVDGVDRVESTLARNM